MLTIDLLNKESSNPQSIIQAVANIETIIQPRDAWDYQTLVDLLSQDSIDLLVVRQNDTIIGYCLYQVIFEQSEILRIGTHPDYQRQGVASQLFTALHTVLISKDAQQLMLEVRADNDAAIALYEQQGFEVIHRRKDYYTEVHRVSVDALIMQRRYLYD
ncbi:MULTISPECIES: ribosomal protein S18-alanine N-acetyltransferase [unclassified Psychrobacter]|uniref:ribosomal protein S18-alanine N-acetyltransferase n=1 Tax=unclassified Psychrobacter TaxID=196806 RepID=UPI003FD1407D